MTRLERRYYNWIISLIAGDKEDALPDKYSSLLEHLYSAEFYAIIGMDENRIRDGVELRYLFSYEFDIPHREVSGILDARRCSILEMMIALANRCENTIMSNSLKGNRTSQWFWQMLDTMGLSEFTNERYDTEVVSDILDDFLERRYSPNGRGGLFYIKNPRNDLRTVDIWIQAMWYFSSMI